MTIPANLRLPFTYTEFDGSNAQQGATEMQYNVLMFGQKKSGSASVLTPIKVVRPSDAVSLFGAGSQLAEMIEAFRLNDSMTNLEVVALADDAAGVASTGAIKVVGTATSAGTLNLMICGKALSVPVEKGATAAQLATLIQSLINSNYIVTSAVDGVDTAKVNLTSAHKGECFNEMTIAVNHYDGQVYPEGISCTLTQFSGGTKNPSLSGVFAAVGDKDYTLIICPYLDQENRNILETELASRFGAIRQIDGYVIAAKRGTFAELSTLGESMNSKFFSLSAHNGPSNPWIRSAAKCGQIAYEGSIDPARPFQTLVLNGVIAPRDTDEFDFSERNLLLYSGVSTDKVQSGKVYIERVITTYRLNEAGSPDTAFLNFNTLLTLKYLRFDWNATMGRKYPRHKAANDGVRLAPGQKVVTPKTIKAEAVAKFEQWEEKGLTEGSKQFKESLSVVRTGDRFDLVMSPDLVNQFRILGTTIAFLN